jgi:hypothetical protein
MTQQEHLLLIRAKCVELLELAKRRTPGRWEEGNGAVWHDCDNESQNEVCEFVTKPNAAFIASAAGPFEAALASTVAAIDGHLFSGACSEWCAEPPEYVTQIIASWPLELLQQ